MQARAALGTVGRASLSEAQKAVVAAVEFVGTTASMAAVVDHPGETNGAKTERARAATHAKMEFLKQIIMHIPPDLPGVLGRAIRDVDSVAGLRLRISCSTSCSSQTSRRRRQ